MPVGLPLLILTMVFIVITKTLAQNNELARPVTVFPSRQIAYNMRLYHQAALAAKMADTSATGTLVVAVPAFLTDWRFISCANAKSVVTYGNGLTTSQSRDLNRELLRQSAVAPELGHFDPSPQFANVFGESRAQTGFAAGIGLFDGVKINNGFAAVTPACALPAGVAALQTQVLP